MLDFVDEQFIYLIHRDADVQAVTNGYGESDVSLKA